MFLYNLLMTWSPSLVKPRPCRGISLFPRSLAKHVSFCAESQGLFFFLSFFLSVCYSCQSPEQWHCIPTSSHGVPLLYGRGKDHGGPAQCCRSVLGLIAWVIVGAPDIFVGWRKEGRDDGESGRSRAASLIGGFGFTWEQGGWYCGGCQVGVPSWAGPSGDGRSRRARGRCANNDTELGLGVHHFFSKWRKAELATFYLSPDPSNNAPALALKPPSVTESTTVIKWHFVRFKQCWYLTKGRWKARRGGQHFRCSEAHSVVLALLEVNEPSGTEKVFIF